MRRLISFIVIILVVSINCFAQNDGKARSLKEDLAKSDVTIQDAKKSVDPKTWMDRGKLFRDIYSLNVNYLRFGMSTNEAKIFFKNPQQVLSSEENGVAKETYEYSQIKLNFENGLLKSWEVKQSIVDNPLAEAVNAYQKASDLDKNQKNTKKINEAYQSINKDLELKAFNEYFLKNYKDACNTSLQKIEASKLLGITDTLFYYNAGYFAYSGNMWKEANDNLAKAAELGYKETGEDAGFMYVMLARANMNLGDTTKAVKYMQEGSKAYPNNIDLVYELINYYLLRGENNEALKFVEAAKANPSAQNNPSLYAAEGSLYEKMGEHAKAIAAYDAGIAKDPKFANLYLFKGIVYFDAGVKLSDEANKEKSDAEYKKKQDLADAEFLNAVAPLEKANELRPGDVDVMQTLKSLYYRLQSKHPEMKAKYEDISRKLDVAK